MRDISTYVHGGYTGGRDMDVQYSEQDLNHSIQKDFYSQLNAAADKLVNQSSNGDGGGTATVNPRDNRTANTIISMTDYDANYESGVTVVGTANNNKFMNYSDNVTISGGAGNDIIEAMKSNVSVSGGAGDDTIHSGYGTNNTIYGGAGNDSINAQANGTVLQYSPGDGDDRVDEWNKFNSASDKTLYIEGDYTRDTVDSSVVFYVGSGSITFTGIIEKHKHYSGRGNIYYTYTETPINVETVPSGTFSSAPEPVYTASSSTGGSSTSSTGSSSSTTTGSSSSSVTGSSSSSSSGTFRGIDDSGAVYSTGGSSTTSSSGSSYTSTTTGSGSSSTVSSSSNIYIGGDKVISNYTGQPVNMTAKYKGANFSGNNFVVNSLTGTLTIENVADKIIDLRDGAGNEFVKAYKASSAGTIDGRGISAYEIIEGSAAGTDIILAGDGGSQLWGGSDSVVDALIGGNGSDIFVSGRFCGTDNIMNASSADIVSLTDTTLSDIVATAEIDGSLLIGFNTGNIISVQSTELLSAAIQLGDGSAWRFNHVTKAWQGA